MAAPTPAPIVFTPRRVRRAEGRVLAPEALATLPPLTLYVHLPWCVRKCPYCDFNSHAVREEVPEAAYVDALILDLESALPSVWGRRVHAVFFGGGTPSLFSPESLDRLMAAIRARLPLEADAEVTLEANPGTVDMARFEGFRSAGINRLSLGVQSFDDDALDRLGRIHDGSTARRAIEAAARTFENFNLDLMYGLPGQDARALQADLEAALAFAPPHLSYYQLTLEPNTVFAKYPPTLPDDDEAARMQEAIEAATARAGLQHYEISAYAREGRRCRHNLNYWNYGDYLGIGAGAHAKISFPDRITREVRYRQPERYLEEAGARRSLVAERHEVAPAERPFEFMLNALRLVEGFPLNRFAERTGVPLVDIAEPLTRAETQGLIERDSLTVRPTARGLAFLNDLQALFLPESDPGNAPT